MQKRSQVVKVVCFLIIGTMLFFGLQGLLTPDFVKDDSANYVGRTIRSFFELEENSIDVLFLGSSHVICGVSPMEIYENTKIRTYSLSTPAQPMECSYYLLKKALETQKPQVVVLDAYRLFETGDEDAMWRYVLDSLPLDPIKIELAQAYENRVAEADKLSALFPIIKYHTRWNNLTETDFDYNKSVSYYSMGQWMCAGVTGTEFTRESLDNEIAAIRKLDPALYDPHISDYGMECLQKIQNLCNENGIELLMVKIPVIAYPAPNATVWDRIKHDQTVAVAEQLQIPFIDMMYDVDTGVDFTVDTMDEGLHLNMHGAKKISDYLGTYLTEKYGIQGTVNAAFEQNLQLYRQVYAIGQLQAEMNFTLYMNWLRENANNLTVLIAGKDNIVPGLDEEDYVLLESMGLQKIRDVEEFGAYLAILEQGECVYEVVSNQEISCEAMVDGKQARIVSPGWNANNKIEISISGMQHAAKTSGLNIVVYDHATGMVIDSVTFNTATKQKPTNRNWRLVNNYLYSYADKVCFGEEEGA